MTKKLSLFMFFKMIYWFNFRNSHLQPIVFLELIKRYPVFFTFSQFFSSFNESPSRVTSFCGPNLCTKDQNVPKSPSKSDMISWAGGRAAFCCLSRSEFGMPNNSRTKWFSFFWNAISGMLAANFQCWIFYSFISDHCLETLIIIGFIHIKSCK